MGKLKKFYKVMVSTVIDVKVAGGYGSDYEDNIEPISYLAEILDCDDKFETPEAAEVALLELLEWYDENNKPNVQYEYSIVPVYTFVKD